MTLVNMDRDLFWDLLEDQEHKRRRAVSLRLVYALASPDGWDARRWEFGAWPPTLARAALERLSDPG